MTGAPLLVIDRLSTQFRSRRGLAPAVDEVSLTLARGEVLGLVGESGSGKTAIGLSILGLVPPPGLVTGGAIRFDGIELTGLSPAAMRALRGRRIAMIFQDPMMTLNPVLTIGTQMIEAVRAHDAVPRAAARRQACAALARVGIAAPEERLLAYPHQFSGGMRQRIAIAIAMLHRPDLIIADEPTTALDVTTQGQILFEMQALIRDSGTAVIWITHDLSVVAGLADSIAVLYAGRIVETGPVGAVLDRPLHPYTRGLIDSTPSRNPRGRPLAQIPGMLAPPGERGPGCAFAGRCGRRSTRCIDMPALAELRPGQWGRCWHPLAATGT